MYPQIATKPDDQEEEEAALSNLPGLHNVSSASTVNSREKRKVIYIIRYTEARPVETNEQVPSLPVSLPSQLFVHALPEIMEME